MGATEMVRQWRHGLEGLLPGLPGLHGHLVNCLAVFSVAMALAGHCHSGRLAAAAPSPRARAFSRQRRWERLLSNRLLRPHEAMGELARSLLPGLADRGLSWPAVLDCCVALGWHYVLRLQRDTRVRSGGRLVKAAWELAGWRGAWRLCTGVEAFKDAGWRRANVVAAWGWGCREPWLLATDLPATFARCRNYCKNARGASRRTGTRRATASTGSSAASATRATPGAWCCSWRWPRCCASAPAPSSSSAACGGCWSRPAPAAQRLPAGHPLAPRLLGQRPRLPLPAVPVPELEAVP